MPQEVRLLLQRYKKHLLLGGLFVVVSVVFIAFAVWQQQVDERAGKIAVQVHTVPKDAIVSVDGHEYDGATIYLNTGTHQATVSKEGFSSYTQELVVNEVAESRIYAGLAPESDDAKKWQSRHTREYAELERQSFQFSQSYGEAFSERFPIVSSLPLQDPYFTISYKVDAGGDIVLTVKGTSPRYREFAIEELRRRGFEPTDYRFEFIGFTNPLEKERS